NAWSGRGHVPSRTSSGGSSRTFLRTWLASARRRWGRSRPRGVTAVPEVTMARAINEALRRSLSEDARTLVLGGDVGRLGGVFRVTEGLQDEFGEERVFDTPLAEAAIAGVCVGLAIAGWRPIAEMQFDAFSYPALDQVISHVAKMRYRSQGRLPMSIV